MTTRPTICTINDSGKILGDFDFEQLKNLKAEAENQYLTALTLDTDMAKSIRMSRAGSFEQQWRRLLLQALKQNLIDGENMNAADLLLKEDSLKERVKV